jgi:hypothetical protein
VTARFLRSVRPPSDCPAEPSAAGRADDNELDLIRNARGHLSSGPYQDSPCAVDTQLIGAVGISEKQERDVSPAFLPEIKRSTDGVGENKSWFRQGRRADLPGCSIQRAALYERILLASEARGYGFPSEAVFPASATCYRHRLETASWPH